MHILVVDTDDETISKLSFLSKISDSFKLKHLDNYKDSLEYYNLHSIDYMIIDFSINDNIKLLEKILEINTEQKIITLSNIPKCSDKAGCDNCITNYNKRRVFKPFSVSDIVNIINDFDKACQYFKQFEYKNIIDIMSKIIKPYVHYDYDILTKTIYPFRKSSSMIGETLEIIELLDNHNINFDVNDYPTIKILD